VKLLAEDADGTRKEVLFVGIKGSDNAEIPLACQIDILDTNIINKK
jgi:hypothetical protein